MKTTNYNIFLGTFVAIAIIGLVGLAAVQLAYAQEEPSAAEELQATITAITGIATTIAALGGGIIASFARMSQKLGLARDSEVQKMLTLAQELSNSDRWCKQIEEDVLKVVEVIDSIPDGKTALEANRVDIKKWKDEVSKLEVDISSIYDKLMPFLAKK